MKPYLPPAALRAARALVGLSQIKVATEAGIAVKSLRSAEADGSVGGEVSARLRGFYEAKDVEFLGVVDIGSGRMSGIGARWWDPQTATPRISPVSAYTCSESEVALLAARAFLGMTLVEVSNDTGIEVRSISAAEDKQSANLNIRDRLIRYYRDRDLILLGRRDLDTNQYLGVGVQESVR